MIEIALIIIVFGKLIYLGYKVFGKRELGFDQKLVVDLTNRCLAKRMRIIRPKMKTLRNHKGGKK